MTASRRTTYALVDGVLGLDVEESVEDLVRDWIPRNRSPGNANAKYEARIEVVGSAASEPRAQVAADTVGKPALTLDGVPLWMSGHAGVMRGPHRVAGALDLDRGRAVIRAGTSGPQDGERSDAYSMLTISAAFLLLVRGRALIHAGAVMAPNGHAWLLVGDSHSGKSTTCLNLIRGGFTYLADDQVVLSDGDRCGITALGWPRVFHLDAGWRSGQRLGRRIGIDPREHGREEAAEVPVAGTIMLTLAPDLPTELARVASAEAFAALVRQSPWFLAHRTIGARGLELLMRVAKLPAYALRAGLDTYRDSDRLLEVVGPVVA